MAMMTIPDPALDDGLELERIAVGPYCVFDTFLPPSNNTSNHPRPAESPDKLKAGTMENPILSGEYPFNNNGMRPPWLNTSGDDSAVATSSAADWNDWMAWDSAAAAAAAAQNNEAKPRLNAQGPMCFTKPGERPPIMNRRQSPQTQDAALGLQTPDIPSSTSQSGRPVGAPFTFGGTVDLPPAFSFDAQGMSSPSSAEQQQQNGFYSPPIWEQQRGTDNTMFSPGTYDQPGMSSTHNPPTSTPSLHHSPSSPNNGSSAQSSPEPAPPTTSKKRKSTSEESDKVSGKGSKQPPIKKTAHNMIEKRYRTNLNDKIAALRDSVPSLRVMSRVNGGTIEDDDPEDLEGLTPAHKLNKATVLSKATEYIRHLEKRNKRLCDEVTTLKTRLENYEKMAISGPMAMHNAIGTPDGSRFQEDPFAAPSHMSTSVSGPPQGMIPVPESMANLHRGLPPQPHYAPAYPYSSAAQRSGLPGPPIINNRQRGGLGAKFMIGSLAGLMILEGFAQREQTKEPSGDRGLFAIPFNLLAVLAPRVSLGGAAAQVPLVKLLLVLGAVFYIVAPLLDFRSRPKKKPAHFVALAPTPSLASPVEVRRKAWLTAIQTVWVPQHNFILELAALGLKMLKLSTRSLIGWDGYAALTGITKEQEAGRVKAWSIALDAQLTGGDAEISKSRLVLSLMASGTLPDTPARLMLKALHIRVLLWELSNAPGTSWGLIDLLSAKLARRYWNAARTEQRIAMNNASKANSDMEGLPDHLAALLERSCDEVLVPSIIQRAYNLAWNRPSAENTVSDESMDRVVEDFAICSPLDALAAWWSSYMLKDTLTGYLASKQSTPKKSTVSVLDLVAHTAPPTSQAHLRVIIAQAIIVDEGRAANIAAAYQALPLLPNASQSPSRAPLMNLVGEVPIAADIRKALTLAKCLHLAGSTNIEARLRAVYVVNNTFLPEATTTLLSFVASYKVLTEFIQDSMLQKRTSQGLERIASSLRLWVGHEVGRRSGLSNKARGRIIGQCLDASKTLVGLAKPELIDDGYVSQSERGDESPRF
ncbi:hypothetical protein P154DRAFT_518355 [Amniculicola lignicola CBS 123094]|uniref:BHLH domain-containing protein n=1 Tax=Amniculicola lignicola CBS 123094 TaxID=1392246 RepID=A0A6A5WVH0_9PLEO|nr:hypothetical protein P154DRAFT_518355 [Amniculicola lignicola CBS 123094]